MDELIRELDAPLGTPQGYMREHLARRQPCSVPCRKNTQSLWEWRKELCRRSTIVDCDRASTTSCARRVLTQRTYDSGSHARGSKRRTLQLGACYLGEGRCQFLVWAPSRTTACCDATGRLPCRWPPKPVDYRLLLHDVAPGTRYRYVLSDGKARPTPPARFQPEGVHGPSEVIDPFYPWTDDRWNNPPSQNTYSTKCIRALSRQRVRWMPSCRACGT